MKPPINMYGFPEKSAQESEYLNTNTQLLFSLIRKEKKYLCYDHYLRQELYP